jgi:hypothetical protein
MEIPLVLRARSGGKLVYAVSGVFRAAMAAILALMAAALFADGGSPGALGWILMALAALAALYEERWTFDPAAGTIAHGAGLVILSRRLGLALGDVERFRIVPFVRGTLPGSGDEAAENAAALAGGRTDDSGRRRAWHKKPYLRLSLETADGVSHFIDALPARKAAVLKGRAARIAEACGKELVEGFD